MFSIKILHSVSKILLSFTLLCTCIAIADDAAFMSKLAKALSPTPSGWSGTSFCEWKGVRCTTNGSTNLVILDLGNTNLIGTLPDVFDSLVSLRELRLSYNNLTGGLPKTFAVSGIQNLWLNNQKDGFGFSGTIEVLASMTRLSRVWLFKNLFTGPIPDLSNCTALFDLQLSDNQLTGVVPPSLMSLSSLLKVSLDNNVLQGPVPSFGKGVKVTLDGVNSFCRKDSGPCDSRVTTLLDIAKDFGYPLQLARSWSGNDPCGDWSFVVCATGKIVTMNLAKQNLTGTISPAFANLTDLKNLYLNDNHLGGSIPGDLVNLAQLRILDVSNNNLSGDVPKFPTKVKFNNAGNLLLGHSRGGGGSDTTPSSGSSDAPTESPNTASGGFSLSSAWIAGIVVIGVFFVSMVVVVFCTCHTINWHWTLEKVKNLENEKKVVLIEGGDLDRGDLDDGTKIAVKRMEYGSCIRGTTGRVTRRVDVYAFGVVLMELISGRKALDSSLPEEMPHLVSWFCRIVDNMKNISLVTDESLNLDDENMESICKVAELAAHCTSPEPHKRPDIWHAVNVLVPLVEQWNPACIHEQHEEKYCDVIYEGHYDMSFSEILSGR
ncbi:Receptor-like kinase [Vigna angularis]|uniref:Receptor-like kinase n=1 Tax=Phaseolus angularis TaxID=3914 RepID=A0A8T0L9L1_PHAAN|nr:Receptor-like kinase [Vigna angularis]